MEKELKNSIIGLTIKEMPNIEHIAEIAPIIINNFLVISKNKNASYVTKKFEGKERRKIKFRIVSSGANGKYKSKKIGNIRINWKKVLLEGVPGLTFAIASVVTIPVLAVFVLLYVVYLANSASEIEISKEHALILFTLWESNIEKMEMIEYEYAYSICNEKFSNLNNKGLKKDVFDHYINDLQKLNALSVNDKKIKLLEETQVTDPHFKAAY